MVCFTNKIKFLALAFAITVPFAFAGEGNMNYYGQLGFHKTQSAQTLGNGRFGVGLFAEGAGLENIIEDAKLDSAPLSPYIGGNVYPFISLGLSKYFDFGISIPIYAEQIKIDGCVKEACDDLSMFGWGNLQGLMKVRAPFDDILPFDISLVFGGMLNVGRTDDYGLWIRDPAFLNVNDSAISPIVEGTSIYTNGNSMFRFGVAITLDLNRVRAEIPLLWHINYMYRGSLGPEASNYPAVQSISTALEWTPVPYVSLMGEYFMDMPTEYPGKGSTLNDFAELSTLSFGISFHFTKKVDLQLGYQMLVGNEGKYVNSLHGIKPDVYYNAAIYPKHMAFGGLTVKLFVIPEPEPVEEEEEYRNPDTDDDGVCDPWVSESGRQKEFSRICKGIDLCPYEPGELADKGCPPVEEAEAGAPTILFTAGPDLIQKGQSVTLTWQTTNATEVTIEGIGEVPINGTKKVKPTENTTYTITATGEGGTQTSTVDVEVSSGPVPTILFTAIPDVIQKGQSVTLTWQTTNAAEVSIDGDIGVVKASGTKKVKPTENTTYTLTATGEGGTITSTVDVEIASGPIPTIIFSSNKEAVQAGQAATLSWQTTNATEISIDGGVGSVKPNGTKQVKPTESTVYTLTATGEGGTQTATVEIEVVAAPVIEAKVNLKGVNFLSGKAELTLDAKRVLDGVAEQLLAYPNVKIEIQGHTDNQGTAKSNQELSERRAKAVVGYLATQGVKMSRMTATGYGQDVPIADNKTASGRELNRRIEMIRLDD